MSKRKKEDSITTHDDQFTNKHPDGTVKQKRTTTVSLDSVKRDGSGTNVDQSGDQRDQERVGDRSQLSEESGSKVEDEIDTGPLLHHL